MESYQTATRPESQQSPSAVTTRAYGPVPTVAATEPPIPRVLLRISEAAEILSLGRTKVYQLIGANELPTVRIGTAVRIPASELYAWVDRQREATRVG